MTVKTKKCLLHILKMFRTPIRNVPETYSKIPNPDLLSSAEKSPSFDWPESGTKNIFIVPTETKKSVPEGQISADESQKESNQISLRAEVELLKNDFENEKHKNENLQNLLKEKEKTIQILSNHLTDKSSEIREMKRKFSAAETENMLEKTRFMAEIECFTQENKEIRDKLEKFKFIETQFFVSKQEIIRKFKNKIKKLKEIMIERHEKYKIRESAFHKEKSKLSDELESILNKFSLLEKNIPALKGFFNIGSIKTTDILNVSDDKLLKNIENEDYSFQADKNILKPSKVASGKENSLNFI